MAEHVSATEATWAPVADEIRQISERLLWSRVPQADVDEVTAMLTRVREYIDQRVGEEPEIPSTFTPGIDVAKALADRYKRRSLVSSPEHPYAPPMHFTVEPDGTATGHLTLGRAYQGPPGRCHGGYVAVLLDHLFGATGAHALPGPFYTKVLEVIYDAGVPLLKPIEVRSWLDRLDGRKAFVAGEITCDGEVCARATGLLVVPKEFLN